MTTTVKKILKQASILPALDRAELIEELLTSFDFPERQEIDALWAKEVERRLQSFSAGHMKAQPAKQVFEHIQRKK
ncbi:MAG: addiction module protein [Candidatus Omnitrophica bacterium]|nr:addiction module protein [Candidatus Omnitrophota bacterium]